MQGNKECRQASVQARHAHKLQGQSQELTSCRTAAAAAAVPPIWLRRASLVAAAAAATAAIVFIVEFI